MRVDLLKLAESASHSGFGNLAKGVLTLWKWKAIIRTRWGDVEILISAPNQHIARQLLESQYGKGTILGNEVRQA